MRGCGSLTCEYLGHFFVLHAVVVQVSGASRQPSDLIGVERASLVLAEGRPTELAAVRLLNREVMLSTY